MDANNKLLDLTPKAYDWAAYNKKSYICKLLFH